MSEFVNEPILELRRAPHREALLAGMRAFTEQAIFRVPVWIGDGERHGEEIVSTDPGDPERVIATAASASADEAAEAVATATRGFARWSATPAEKRAEILIRAAAWMRERRGELAALEVRECAKPWGEADADIELQILRGLGDALQEAVAAQGLRVRAYCPVGDLVAGMAYLVRRLLENTSNDSFLQEQARGVPVEELLAKPEPSAA